MTENQASLQRTKWKLKKLKPDLMVHPYNPQIPALRIKGEYLIISSGKPEIQNETSSQKKKKSKIYLISEKNDTLGLQKGRKTP